MSTPEKEIIVNARKQGMPRQDVARLLGCTPTTVSLVMAKMNASGNVHRCKKKGRPRITTKNEDRFLTGAFSSTGPLVLIKSTMDSRQYIVILDSYLLPFATASMNP